MSYVLVTCIFDVKKRDQGFSKRTVARYISLFNYILSLKCKVILFTENHIIDNIPSAEGLTKISIQLEDLPIYTDICQSGVTDIPKNLPLINRFYSTVINSKYYLLSVAKKYIDTNITHLIWLDAGIAHVGFIAEQTFKEHIVRHIHPQLITLVMMNATFKSEVSNMKEFLNYNREKIAAGLAIVPVSDVEWLHTKLYSLYLSVLKEHKLICIEEQLLPIITLEHPEKFAYIYSYYHILRNLRYITSDLNIIIKNIVNCRANGNNKLALEILEHVLASILSNSLVPTVEQFCEIFYNAQILYYYRNKNISKRYSIYLGWMYHHNVLGRQWIEARKNNIKENISYNGVDLDTSTIFSDQVVIANDPDNIMWLLY